MVVLGAACRVGRAVRGVWMAGLGRFGGVGARGVRDGLVRGAWGRWGAAAVGVIGGFRRVGAG